MHLTMEQNKTNVSHFEFVDVNNGECPSSATEIAVKDEINADCLDSVSGSKNESGLHNENEIKVEEFDIEDQLTQIPAIFTGNNSNNIYIGDDEANDFLKEGIGFDEKNRFECGNCPETYDGRDHLKRHILTHKVIENQNSERLSDNKLYTCDICKKNFFNKSHVRQHVQYVHLKLSKPNGKNKFQCESCLTIFHKKQSLLKHACRNKKNGDNSTAKNYRLDDSNSKINQFIINISCGRKLKYKCSLCNKIFSNRSNIRRHVREIHVDKRIYICKYCKKIFKTKKGHVIHIRSIHFKIDDPINSRRYKKSSVNYYKKKISEQIETNQLLKSHSTQVMTDLHSKKLLLEKCLNINISFDKSSFVIFKNLHDLDQNVTRNLSNVSSLSSHNVVQNDINVIENHNTAISSFFNNSIFVCNVNEFGKVTNQKKNIQRKIKNSDSRISKTLKYRCEFCPNSYTLKSSLIQHKQKNGHLNEREKYTIHHERPKIRELIKEVIHNGSKIYQCGACNKISGLKTSIRRHIKEFHIGKQTYECDHCKKILSRKQSMIDHLKLVHKEKKEKCPVCQKSLNVDDIKPHVEAHYEKKPYICSICPKQFNTDFVLNLHINNHRAQSQKSENKKLN